MDYTIQKLDGEPVVLLTVQTKNMSQQELLSSIDETIHTLDTQSEQVFLIEDLRDLTVGFDELLIAVNAAGRQLKMFNHPKLREVLVVTRNQLLALSAKGMSSPIFGGAKIKVFATLDEALAYARKA